MLAGEGLAGPGPLSQKGAPQTGLIWQAHLAPPRPSLTPLAPLKQILDVVSDIDNEISVTVMSSDLLPAECKAQLEAKRCSL